MRKPQTPLLALFAVFLAAPAAEAAMDAKAVADALIASDTAEIGGVGGYESAVSVGNDVVITRYHFVATDGLASEQARVVVTDPTPRAGGGFTSTKIAYEGAEVRFPLAESLRQAFGIDTGLRLTYREEGGWMEDVTVSAKTAAGAEPLDYERAGARGIALFGPKMEPLGTAAAMAFAFTDAGGISRLAVSVDDITARLDTFGLSLADIGYGDQLGGAFRLNVTLDDAAGTLDLDELALTVNDVGTLRFAASIAGLGSAKLIDSKLSTDDQMLAIYTSGTLKSARLGFDNAGIVERLLDRQAMAAGIGRAAFAASMANALPLLLTSTIRDAAFRSAFAAAAGAFLKDPKSLILTAEPDKPTALAQLFFSLENLPEVLRLKVSNTR